MKKIIVASDSFKGTLTSEEICDICTKTIKKQLPSCQVIPIPIADGGEGTVDAFIKAINASKIEITVKDSYFNTIKTYYAIKDTTAFIEVASSSGLPQVENNKNPSLTSTYGIGEQIQDAINKGVNKIVLGLGGSSTNDGGCGCASALKVKFYDKNNKEFIPTGKTLININKIDTSECKKLLKNVEIIAMCDVTNKMYGKNGAAYIFAPQKGANKEMVKELDKGLKHLAKIIKKDLKMNIANIKGTGAAGALGAGIIAFFNGKLQSGIDTILDITDFNNKLENTDLVITGEGKVDLQSLKGKTISGVIKRCKEKNINVIIISGIIDKNCLKHIKKEKIIKGIYPITKEIKSFEEIKKESKNNYQTTLTEILNSFK